MKKIVVDTHTHTVASGHAYSTIIENCIEASKKGIELIAMTDHGPAMPGGPHIFHFGNLKVIPRYIHGVEVLKGIEANIVDYDGKLDLNAERMEKIEIVIASLHDVCIAPGSVKDNTRALINAMKNKYVDIIGHPGNPMFPIEIDEVLDAAIYYNVMIEINNSSLGVSRIGSYENCSLIAKHAAKKGNIIALGTDSHICYSVGEFSKAVEIIERAGIDDDHIINNDKEKLKEYLRKKGKIIK